VKGYTKNQAMKNIPMLSSTTDRCGNTAGLMGLTYRLIELIAMSCRTAMTYKQTIVLGTL